MILSIIIIRLILCSYSFNLSMSWGNWAVPGTVDKHPPHSEARSKASGLMPHK